MARPREFDIDDAIDGAMGIFWRQGFKATNLPDLLEAMGLTRGSFYKAFGDKENAYLRSLLRYDETIVTETIRALESCESNIASDCLKEMFRSSSDGTIGCFICNAMVEVAPDNQEVARLTKSMANRLKQAVLNILVKSNPSFPNTFQHELADIVLHLYFGFQALGKAGSNEADWENRLKIILAV